MKIGIVNNPSAEQHFLICLYLMLLFFFVDLGTSALLALHITEVQIGGGESHDAYIAFFGIALGIFRGMTPQGGELPPNTESTTQTVTTATTVVPPAQPIPAPEETKIVA